GRIWCLFWRVRLAIEMYDLNGGPGLWRDDGEVDDLADLAAGGVVAWAELKTAGAAGVAGDDSVGVGGLYLWVEGVGGGHVAEGGGGRGVGGPVLGQDYYLAQLGAGDVVAWAIF